MISEPANQGVELERLRGHLVNWLTRSAYPCWALHGVDDRNGGFFEALGGSGRGLDLPRRARVHPRQIYAFSQAHRFGWRGDPTRIVRRGIEFFTTCYRRGDGLFRALVGADGASLDERALLYDQAFALLGYAGAAATLTASAIFEQRALDLYAAIESRLRAPEGGFHSGEGASDWRESNAHMHLLEACLIWAELGKHGGWMGWAKELVDLALERFIRRESGALGEYFDGSWNPAPGLAGRLIEPGHQFEWAWLLLKSPWAQVDSIKSVALRLIEVGERGVRNQVAVNSLLEDFSIHDSKARLWPQTERLKAALLAAERTGQPHYLSIARSAAASLLPYLATPVAGLWFDVQLPSGELLQTPSPASTFYHLVGAIAALDEFPA